MILLGWQEANLSLPREIRQEVVKAYELVDTDTVVIEVPAASVMIAINNTPGRPNDLTIYYECVPTSRPVSVKLRGLSVGDDVPERYHLLGNVWVAQRLLAIYAGVPQDGE